MRGMPLPRKPCHRDHLDAAHNPHPALPVHGGVAQLPRRHTIATKYRKKPVVIEAMLLGYGNMHEVTVWCGGNPVIAVADPHINIVTLEGTMRAELGDFIIRGVQGEFYPCKPDIFAATYEPADAIREVHAYGRAPVTEITEKA